MYIRGNDTISHLGELSYLELSYLELSYLERCRLTL